MRNWCVLYTKPNSERRVETVLRERGIETFLPEISKTNNRKKVTKFDGPITPGQRVPVILTILGSVKKVKIDAANLEKPPSGAHAPTPKTPRRTRGRGRYI